MRQNRILEATGNWRAVCAEKRMHGSGRGGWKRAGCRSDLKGFQADRQHSQHLASHLLYGLTHTVAAFTNRSVVIHRLKSDETAVRMEFSAEEIAALVEGYQSSLAECEGGTTTPEFDPFADVPDEHE